MSPSPFQIRAVVEGFYGVFYTFPERNDLIRFIGEHGYNLYIYGPKNDRQHRARWRDPYPVEVMDQFAETVATAQAAGVTFCYAISFGDPMVYSSPADFEKITAKFRAFYNRGVRSFSILFDDMECELAHEVDRQRYGSCAAAHVDVCNRLYDWLQSLDAGCALSMCPTHYHGRAPFSGYIHELGAGLHPAIDIFYTGAETCAPTISAADAESFAQAVRRAPLIWDNYPVNDLDMRSELHMGPIRGREATLHRAVRGIAVNTMVQAEASKLALLTFADYFADPHSYEPWCSWEAALRTLGGKDGYEPLRQFAENSLHSCLGPEDAPTLERLVGAALAALGRGEAPSASADVRALGDYIDSLDESCYFLKNRMRNLPLRANLLPWIEALDDWVWMGKRALLALDRMERGAAYEQPVRLMQRSLEDIDRHTRRIAGVALLELARYVGQQVALGQVAGTEQPERAAQPAFQPLGGLSTA
jgi:hyaluronoglucosaminidase